MCVCVCVYQFWEIRKIPEFRKIGAINLFSCQFVHIRVNTHFDKTLISQNLINFVDFYEKPHWIFSNLNMYTIFWTYDTNKRKFISQKLTFQMENVVKMLAFISIYTANLSSHPFERMLDNELLTLPNEQPHNEPTEILTLRLSMHLCTMN